jgi:hypothetical protein
VWLPRRRSNPQEGRASMKFKLAVVILASLLFSAMQARGDSVYEVIGSLTVPGNSANPGVGETIKYSFEMDYYTDQNGYQVSAIVGAPVITLFGALGTFYTVTLSGQAGYVGFYNTPVANNSSTAEIDLQGTLLPRSGRSRFLFKESAGLLSGLASSPCRARSLRLLDHSIRTGEVDCCGTERTPQPFTSFRRLSLEYSASLSLAPCLCASRRKLLRSRSELL